MKLCKDCRHCDYQWGKDYYEPRCFARHSYSKSLVNGSDSGPISWCHLSREADGICGPEAKLFEPKRKWWRFW